MSVHSSCHNHEKKHRSNARHRISSIEYVLVWSPVDGHLVLGVLVDRKIDLLLVIVKDRVEVSQECIAEQEHERVTNDLGEGDDTKYALVLELGLDAEVSRIYQVSVRHDVEVEVVYLDGQVAKLGLNVLAAEPADAETHGAV